MNESDRKFLESRQEALRLGIALERFFETDSEPELKERYGSYLRRRVRPAMERLIAEGALDKTEVLADYTGFSERNLDDFIGMAIQQKQSEILVYLLKLKNERNTEPNSIRNTEPSEPNCIRNTEPAELNGIRSTNPAEAYIRKNMASAEQIACPEEICREIWCLTRDSLAICYPLFRGLLSDLAFCAQNDTQTIGTDGAVVYYEPQMLIFTWRRSPETITHLLLHMLFHKLFLHLLLEPEANLQLWDLACDIAAERLIREKREEIRPQQIYRELEARNPDEEELERLNTQYRMDDHSFWNRADRENLLAQLQKSWDQFASRDGSEGAGTSGGRGDTAGTLAETLLLQKKKTYDFRRYLRRYAVTREEMKTDMESFDYILYLYGLAHYGNLPLIEHLEYQEVHKLEELVIAIDTSGSCKSETIRRFMEETYGILSDRENFFDRMNVYVIQADFCVQDVAHITSEAEWNTYLDHLAVHGRSGTDFRPVFAYVEQLREKKELKDLRGLLYFTDGDGIYPEHPTDYETAFVFYQEKEYHQKVPSWAVKLELEGEQDEH